MYQHFAGNAFDTKKLRTILKKLYHRRCCSCLGSKYIDGNMVGSSKYSDITVFLHPVKTIAWEKVELSQLIINLYKNCLG